MKKTLLAFIILSTVYQVFAQWTSPGVGNFYSLESLATATPTNVGKDAGTYTINGDITISASDTLFFEDVADTLFVSGGITIKIKGTLITATRDNKLVIKGINNESMPFEFQFDSASSCLIKDVSISNCNRILLSNSEITINRCEFSHFSSHVISFMNCSPVITNSYFHNNNACAIQSAINTYGSPQILHNTLYNNVLNNSNNPQINIGPGTNDTIRIIGNRIEGVASTMSGGIGISNLYEQENTNIVVKDNTITHNRYGYTQNGYHISSFIIGNNLVENNLEVNPNNGGSGISIFGYDTTCMSVIRNNLITGNLWGITTIYYHSVDLGREDDLGENIIYENGNGGIEYALFNNSSNAIDAVGNYWGHDNVLEIEDVIFHATDSAIYGLVNYEPFNVLEPAISTFAFLKENNPQLNADAIGCFSQTSDTIYVEVDSDEENVLYSLRPSITHPCWVSVYPNSGDAQNFAAPVAYTASTPHQSAKNYVVIASRLLSLEERSDYMKIYPNPLIDNLLYIQNNGNEIMFWEIATIDGKVVARGSAATGLTSINLQNLSNGNYIFRNCSTRGSYMKKLIIQ